MRFHELQSRAETWLGVGRAREKCFQASISRRENDYRADVGRSRLMRELGRAPRAGPLGRLGRRKVLTNKLAGGPAPLPVAPRTFSPGVSEIYLACMPAMRLPLSHSPLAEFSLGLTDRRRDSAGDRGARHGSRGSREIDVSISAAQRGRQDFPLTRAWNSGVSRYGLLS
jgi:hypothetical protein